MLEEIFSSFPVLPVNDFCYLRCFRKSDAQNYFEFYSRPEVNKFLPDSMIPHSLAESADEIQCVLDSYNNKETVYWVIARKDNDQLIGGCGFLDWNRYHSRIEVAYDLHPDYWRNGIMYSCVRVILMYAFVHMKVKRVQATTVTDNPASHKLLLKLGFHYEGLLKNYKFFKGKIIDVMMFGYTVQDFKRDVDLGKY